MKIRAPRKSSNRQYCWRIRENFHSEQQNITNFSNVKSCLFIRLHFSRNCCNRRRTLWNRHGFQFYGIHILPADHVYRRVGIYDKLSFLNFNFRKRMETPIIGNWNQIKSCLSYTIKMFSVNLHAASRTHRSCHSVTSWDRSWNFGSLGLRWWRSPGEIDPNCGFWSRMLAWRTAAVVN